jgi:hypothetical protein
LNGPGAFCYEVIFTAVYVRPWTTSLVKSNSK